MNNAYYALDGFTSASLSLPLLIAFEETAVKATPRPRSCALLVSIVIPAVLAVSAASAERLTEPQARAIVAPFYAALSAGADVPALLGRATTPSWMSCGGNDDCRPLDSVVGSVTGLQKSVPDLKWEIKDVLVAGDRIIVRGEATGTPSGDFSGVAYGGKSFRIMSIDVHAIEGGKIARSYHLEDWRGAARQLAAR
jgi:predicted ester cyclase